MASDSLTSVTPRTETENAACLHGRIDALRSHALHRNRLEIERSGDTVVLNARVVEQLTKLAERHALEREDPHAGHHTQVNRDWIMRHVRPGFRVRLPAHPFDGALHSADDALLNSDDAASCPTDRLLRLLTSATADPAKSYLLGVALARYDIVSGRVGILAPDGVGFGVSQRRRSQGPVLVVS